MNITEAALKGWIGFITRNAVAAAVLIALSTIGVGYFAASQIGINTNTEDMLSPDLEFRKNAKAMDKAFPQFDDNIVVVLDGANADLVADAASALTGALAKSPDIYGDVFDPKGLAFFAKNGFLYLSKPELESLVARLNDAQPFIGRLWNDPTLPGLFATLRLILEESAKAAGGQEIAALGGVLKATEAVVRAAIKGERKSLSWRNLIAGEDATDGNVFRAIILKPRLDYGSLQPGGDVIDRLRGLFAELQLENNYQVRARLTGSVALEYEELESVVDGLGLAGVLSFSLVILLLIWGLKNLKLAGAVLATLVAGLIWTAGFAALAVGTLNLISVAFAVLFIGLSVDFGIHYTLRYAEALGRGQAGRDALVEAGADVGGALILSAVAAAMGFLAFVPTDYIGLAELGIIAGGGMFIALAANLTCLPALLMLMPVAGKNITTWARKGGYRWARPFGLVIGAAGLIGLVLVPQVRFDFDPLNLKDRQSESVASLFDLMRADGGGPYQIEILAESVDHASRLAGTLAKLPTVKSAISVSDLIPSDQEIKLEIAETLGFTLAPSLSLEPERKRSSHKDRLAAMQEFRKFLDRGENSGGAQNLSAALSDFAAKFQGEPDKLQELELRLTWTLINRMVELRQALDAAPINIGALPATLRSRQIAKDGRAMVTVKPKADLTDRTALAEFVAEVRSIAPEAAGSPVTILEAGRVVVAAFVQAALWAFIAIALLVLAITRSLREIGLIFAPLLVAASLTMTVSVLADLPFNFANVIVLPLLFGLGIASAIHIVMREKSADTGAMATSTPRAVVFSALTTIGSFASISLSGHPGTASMGVLLTIAITLTLVSTLTVLPALIAVFPVGKRA
ncbi:MAG: MMPL family transporter [Rhodospirillaceae bacterium]|nr:MMPL family transporter [Rhodospirillaceae bacterium]